MGNPVQQFWPPVSVIPRIGNEGNPPWDDPSYIPSGPMRTTSRPATPLPGNVPSSSASQPIDAPTSWVSDPWHQATVVSSINTPGVVATPDQQPFLLAPITQRNLLTVRNASVGGQNVFLEFGKPASTTTVIVLVPNQILLFDAVVPQDDLYAACDIAGGVLAFGYSTISPPKH